MRKVRTTVLQVADRNSLSAGVLEEEDKYVYSSHSLLSRPLSFCTEGLTQAAIAKVGNGDGDNEIIIANSREQGGEILAHIMICKLMPTSGLR